MEILVVARLQRLWGREIGAREQRKIATRSHWDWDNCQLQSCRTEVGVCQLPAATAILSQNIHLLRPSVCPRFNLLFLYVSKVL